jgi:hypothetical protein
MHYLLAFLLWLPAHAVFAQYSTVIEVHCFYGSRPLKAYKDVESKWFGGVWGGHVSIGWDSSRVLSFLHHGRFHWFARKNDRHSRFLDRQFRRYRKLPDTTGNPVKQAIIYIPISPRQKEQLDSIAEAYLRETPYDYAFFGMRCAAATYEILGQLGVVEPWGHRKTWVKMFYPRPFRKHLFRQAEKHGWRIERQEGSPRRKWDWDYW